MGRFVDLYLEEPENPSEIFRLLSLLGYGMVAVSLPEKLAEKFKDYKKTGGEFGIDVVSRINLTPSSAGELLQKLGGLRKRFELIGVLCGSKQVLRAALRDGRADLVLLPPSKLNLFDDFEAELASNSNTILEICFSHFLGEGEKTVTKAFSMLYGVIGLVKRFGLPLVVSSGAKNVYGVKAPRDLAAFIRLFGLTVEEALATVSKNPKKIVERNRGKLDKSFVGVGVRVLCREGGEDG